MNWQIEVEMRSKSENRDGFWGTFSGYKMFDDTYEGVEEMLGAIHKVLKKGGEVTISSREFDTWGKDYCGAIYMSENWDGESLKMQMEVHVLEELHGTHSPIVAKPVLTKAAVKKWVLEILAIHRQRVLEAMSKEREANRGIA